MPAPYTMHRVYAFAVQPQRTSGSGDGQGPTGGACTVTDTLAALIQTNIQNAAFDGQPEVVFRFDPATRTCGMRDSILDLAFEPPIPAGQAAQAIALTLAQAMDNRSQSALLVLAVEKKGKERRVTLWAFPKETAFHFSMNGAKSKIDVLNDVFSQSSILRKAVMFSGVQAKTAFLDGRVLDHQIGSRSGYAASFWVERFLECTLAVTSDTGTRMVAAALRKTMEGTDDPSVRKAIAQTVTAIHQSNQARWSCKKIAQDYLTGDAATRFLEAVGDLGRQTATFDLDRALFESSLNYRVFELETGVFVSSPFSEVNHSVQLVDGDGQNRARLRCEGLIKTEKVRSRHA